ncbi:uncharacterized protein LOC141825651 [Curcuma longa]|uniref:uncharacterized protein LOC141825651 n=1 Tax=Curcuma longa TaxID=136217 RepID=UPI003D9E283B
MGSCHSSEAATLGSAAATAKVVLSDGGLREYTRRVTAGSVLGKDAGSFFVCDADEMEIEGFVSEVGAEEELLPGQLYFVLPRAMLKHPLLADELAALAVKASAALMGSCGKRAMAPLVFPAADVEEGAGDRRSRVKGRKKRTRSGSGRKFAPHLSAIRE